MKPAAMLKVSEPIKHTQHYETAAWFREYASQTGCYPCELVYDRYQKRYKFSAKLPATITDACLVSIFGGNAYGRDPGKDEIGKAGEFTKSFCPFEVFASSGHLAHGLRNASAAALKTLEGYFGDYTESHRVSFERYRAESRFDMMAHCAGEIAKGARALHNLRGYRSKRVAYAKGRLAQRHGAGLDSNPYERSGQYTERVAWHDGWHAANKNAQPAAQPAA